MTRAVAGGAGAAVSVKSPVAVTVKAWLAVPSPVVTVSGPVLAPIGTVAVISVGMSVRITAARPLKGTVVAPGTKFAPLMVTRVPMGPVSGVTLVITGPRITLKLRLAGVGSSLPARSRRPGARRRAGSRAG